MELQNIVISPEKEQKIRDNAPDKMPLNPTAQGWTGSEVRKRIAQSIVGSDASVLQELKEKLVIIKSMFESVFNGGDGNIQNQINSVKETLATIEMLNGVFNVLKFNVDFNEPLTKEAGMVYYSKDIKTWVFINEFGQEINLNQAVFSVGKIESGTMFEGQPVCWHGVRDSQPVFKLAQAIEGYYEMISVVASSENGGYVLDNEHASITNFGVVKNVNLNHCLEFETFQYISALNSDYINDNGVPLYLSQTSEGKYTHVYPSSGVVMWVGTLLKAETVENAVLFIAPTVLRRTGINIHVGSVEPTNAVAGDIWLKIV